MALLPTNSIACLMTNDVIGRNSRYGIYFIVGAISN